MHIVVGRSTAVRREFYEEADLHTHTHTRISRSYRDFIARQIQRDVDVTILFWKMDERFFRSNRARDRIRRLVLHMNENVGSGVLKKWSLKEIRYSDSHATDKPVTIVIRRETAGTRVVVEIKMNRCEDIAR